MYAAEVFLSAVIPVTDTTFIDVIGYHAIASRGFSGSAGLLAIAMVGCDSNSPEGWVSSAVAGLILIIPDER